MENRVQALCTYRGRAARKLRRARSGQRETRLELATPTLSRRDANSEFSGNEIGLKATTYPPDRRPRHAAQRRLTCVAQCASSGRVSSSSPERPGSLMKLSGSGSPDDVAMMGPMPSYQTTDPALAINRHVMSFFEGHTFTGRQWRLGPSRQRLSNFSVSEISPGPRFPLWTYVSVGCWPAFHSKSGHGLEFVLSAPSAKVSRSPWNLR